MAHIRVEIIRELSCAYPPILDCAALEMPF